MADLITSTEYKTLASIASTEIDAKLTILIPMVSAFVKTYCGREFANNTVTATVEYHRGGNMIMVREPPIISVDSVEQKLTSTASYTALTSGVDYEFDVSSNSIVSLCSTGFLDIPNAIKVTYKGGYASIPGDLKLGVYSLISYYLKNEQSPRKALNGRDIYTDNPQSQDLPPHIKRVLELYRIII